MAWGNSYVVRNGNVQWYVPVEQLAVNAALGYEIYRVEYVLVEDVDAEIASQAVDDGASDNEVSE